MPASAQLVSVVVPVRAGEADLDACLTALRAQDYPNLQILVVARGEADAVRRAVRRHISEDARVELATDSHASVATSLNLALAAAHGRWLLRLDPAVTLPRTHVSRAVAGLRTGSWDGIGAAPTVSGATPAARAIAAVAALRFAPPAPPGDPGQTQIASAASLFAGTYAVAALRRVGGWDARQREFDTDLDRRLRDVGFRLGVDPGLVVQWPHQPSLRAVFHQYRSCGEQDVAAPAAAAGRRRLIAPTLLLSWGIAGALALHRPREAAVLVAPSVLALAGSTAGVARGLQPDAERRWVAPALVAMHTGWTVGAVRATVTKWTAAGRARTATPVLPQAAPDVPALAG